jgi:hypothetical protein
MSTYEDTKHDHKQAKKDRETINDPFTPETYKGEPRPPVDPTPLCYDPGPCPDTLLEALSDWIMLRTNNPQRLALAARGRAAALHARAESTRYVTGKDREPYEVAMIEKLIAAINDLLVDDWFVYASPDRFYWLTKDSRNVVEVKS